MRLLDFDSRLTLGDGIREMMLQVDVERLADCWEMLETCPAEWAGAGADAGHGMVHAPEAEGMPAVIDRRLVERCLQADGAR